MNQNNIHPELSVEHGIGRTPDHEAQSLLTQVDPSYDRISEIYGRITKVGNGIAGIALFGALTSYLSGHEIASLAFGGAAFLATLAGAGADLAKDLK